MKNKLNNDFIKAINEILPERVNIANRIMEILDIGKEASYRRLRNEVPFTFYEVALIARQLGISLDQVIGNYDSNTAVFNLNIVHSEDPFQKYCNTLERFKDYLSFMKGDPSASISSVSNSVPYLLYLPYKHIMKFRQCHWLHQTNKFKPGGSLTSITLPEKIQTLQRKLNDAILEVPNTYMIWDMNIFYTFIKEIDYFRKLNYINDEDVRYLKEDLITLLDTTEKMASEGCYSNGNKINIYLSNIHFESSYTYIEKGNFRVSMVRLYSVNSIDSLYPEICRLQKEWIQTLKRYSTLITESGQMQRINFFNEQRKLVNSL